MKSLLLKQQSRIDFRNAWLLNPADLCVLLSLSVVTTLASVLAYQIYGSHVLKFGWVDRWFQSDVVRVVIDMTQLSGRHVRGSVHPFFSLITIPLTNSLMAVTGVGPIRAIALIHGATLVAWVNLLYMTQRWIGCPRSSSILVCILGLTSASSVFWFLTPETYPLGSLSLLACLAVSARSTRRAVSWLSITAVSFFSMSITISNWMAGLALLASRLSLINAIKSVILSVICFLGLWIFQRAIYPQPPGLIVKSASLTGEMGFLLHPESGGPAAILPGELLHPVVMPSVFAKRDDRTGGMLSIQGASIRAAGVPAVVAASCWGLLLLGGGIALIRGSADLRFRLLLGSVLAGQIVLHLIYGEETFLYALHFLPLLLLTVSLATLTRWRRVVEVLLIVTIGCALWNNLNQLNRAVSWPGASSLAASKP